MSEEEWHEGVAIIDCIELLTLEILLHVVFNDGGLMNSGSLSPCGVNADAISESKDVLESLVL